MSINIRVCLKECLPHLTANVGTPTLFSSGLRPCLGSPCGCSFRGCWPWENRSGGCSYGFRGCWPRGNRSRGCRLSPPLLLTVFCFFVAVLSSLSWILMSFSFFPQTMNSPCRSWLHSGSRMQEPSNQPPHPRVMGRLSEAMRILPILRVLVKL